MAQNIESQTIIDNHRHKTQLCGETSQQLLPLVPNAYQDKERSICLHEYCCVKHMYSSVYPQLPNYVK